jgi:hypothetical protein
MNRYLGEEIVDIKDTPFKDYNKLDWIMFFIEYYGQIDGAHHKQWVLDQIARIKHNTPIIIKLATWEYNHSEYRVSTGTPSDEYLKWVLDMRGWYNAENEEYEYDYDEGIAP